jgi:DUF2934 family protein
MSDGSFYGRRRRRLGQGRVSVKIFPTFDEIAERAYQLFVADGKRVERVFDHWQRAEDELLDRAARRVIR